MCGIFGINTRVDEGNMSSILDLMEHRGPDNKGWYIRDHFSLGHTRLRIIDLNTGDQPMFNEDKQLAVIFNGEIYNYKEIKKNLIGRGHIFSSNSDTEVILHAYEEYGVDCVNRFNGEFAFCLWDNKKKMAFLARDRLGIKPLYYYYKNDQFVFASEIGPMLATGLINNQLNIDSVFKYFTLRYVPGNESMYSDIYRLPPGTYMIFDSNGLKIQRYWSCDLHVDISLSHDEYESKFLELLKDSVRKRLISDVPLGAYLSGGIDSSSIVAFMSQMSGRPVKTFTVGFNTDIDENEDAKAIARHYGTDHQEIYIRKNDYELLPEVLRYFDEPIGDAIIIPTYLLSKMTSQSIKVVLTGEGADEILGGYVHHLAIHYKEKYDNYVPVILKKLNEKLIKNIPITILNSLFPYPAGLGNNGRQRLLTYLQNSGTIQESYLNIASVFDKNERNSLFSSDFLAQNNFADIFNFDFFNYTENNNPLHLNKVIDIDLKGWLPDYTLLKHDRMTMSNSLEGRVPFLDHRIVEFCATLPLDLKIKWFNTKTILRKAMAGYLPPVKGIKKKRSFYLPVEKCFDSGFSDFIRDSLSERALNNGLFNWKYIKSIIDNQSNDLLNNKKLMALLIFQIWLKQKAFVKNEKQ